jgi:hypothetical protein
MNRAFAFANRHLSVVHRWGQSDCMTFVADWVREVHGVDPAADLRMTYGTQGECQRVTGFFTDPLAVVRPRMEALGFAEVPRAQVGDVGLLLQVVAPSVTRPFGAICLGQQWVTLSDQGLELMVPQKVIAVWGIGLGAADYVPGTAVNA